MVCICVRVVFMVLGGRGNYLMVLRKNGEHTAVLSTNTGEHSPGGFFWTERSLYVDGTFRCIMIKVFRDRAARLAARVVRALGC